jgi:hypothetical protein
LYRDIQLLWSDVLEKVLGPRDLEDDVLTDMEEHDGDQNAGLDRGGRRKKHPRSAEGRARDEKKKLVREMKKLVAKADRGRVLFARLREQVTQLQLAVAFPSFQFYSAIQERSHHHVSPAHWDLSGTLPPSEWDESRPRMAVSEDGVPIVLHLPLAIKTRGSDCLYEILMQFGKAAGPSPGGEGADKKGRNLATSYRVVPGQVAGNVKLVAGWHAVGHPVRKAHLLS